MLPLMVLIALLAIDFADYWCHRPLHTKWFWPIHSIHHSDTHVTVLTTARVYFLESSAMKLFYIVLLGWLGFPSGVLGGGAVLLLVHNMYTHIDWGHVPTNNVIELITWPVTEWIRLTGNLIAKPSSDIQGKLFDRDCRCGEAITVLSSAEK